MLYAICLVGCQATIGDPGEVPEQDRADGATDPSGADPGGSEPDGAVTPPGPADGGVADDSPQARCVESYGGVAGFQLCVAADDACTFVAANGDVSCRDHCEPAGGSCLGAQDNVVGECNDLEDDPTADCDTTGKMDLLCTCSLPPGA